mgnify:CR=1 FL=1
MMDISTEELEKRVECRKQGYWEIPDNLDTTGFDFDWRPSPQDRPYIHQFGTQWQKTGGPKYISSGATKDSPVKYIDTRILKAKRLPNPNNPCWQVLDKIKDFDFNALKKQ